MSYRRAWLLMHSLDDALSEPAVKLSIAGRDGGGARLTKFGTLLIASNRAFESTVDALAIKAFACIRPARDRPGAYTVQAKRTQRRALCHAGPKQKK
jgi:molybdate transport system regulatory protein